MESAGLRLHNRLNPAEIQVSLKGTGRRHPSRQACLVKQVRTGAAECEPPCTTETNKQKIPSKNVHNLMKIHINK